LIFAQSDAPLSYFDDLEKLSNFKKYKIPFMRQILFLIILALNINACKSSKQNFATKDSLQPMKMGILEKAEYEKCDCNDVIHYAPDPKYPSHSTIKYLRMNFHIMNSEDGKQNMTEKRGNWYINELVKQCNTRLGDNVKMNLPVGNNTPALPINIRYVLTGKTGSANDDGIYYHYDDEFFFFVASGKNKNNYSKEVVNKYEINKEFVLNSFIQVTHPDSMRSKTYKVHDAGIGMGNSLKIAGFHERNREPHEVKGIFNHEVGHCLGLRHTWAGNDGCDDTPNHPNCWNKNAGGKCSEGASNNMMDYNNAQKAVTPCQIGRMHRNFAKVGSKQRKMLVANWCKLNPEQHIYIRDRVHWKGAKDLEGHVTIRPRGELKISCRTSIPKNGKITVEPGGKLILDGCRLHNACGDKWKGIEILKKGRMTGEVLTIGEPTIEDTPNFSKN